MERGTSGHAYPGNFTPHNPLARYDTSALYTPSASSAAAMLVSTSRVTRPSALTPAAAQCTAVRATHRCCVARNDLTSRVDDITRTLAALTTSVALLLSSASHAAAMDAPAATRPSIEAPEAVYFGNGCFWGRQFDFVSAEKALGRGPEQISAVVGYAGGRQTGPDGKVCYYLADPRLPAASRHGPDAASPQTVYEKLGHAEVVKVQLSPEAQQQQQEFRRFADTYFKQFRRTADGRMQRLDPQDAGPGYRNVIGLPGGVSSPLFPVLQAANVNGMELRAGSGNEWQQVEREGRQTAMPMEDDLLNVVWVVDSGTLPFYQAERYHQFHNGIGKMFPLLLGSEVSVALAGAAVPADPLPPLALVQSYTWDLKNMASRNGVIKSTGCPELPF
ncbi:hypothetical protein QJQ45_030301 [Haematococcus lacustris]|nr:hypothetical protein QJQ45_030301 [Haematococcus lacustris]